MPPEAVCGKKHRWCLPKPAQEPLSGATHIDDATKAQKQ
jgi:hypothetical protein